MISGLIKRVPSLLRLPVFALHRAGLKTGKINKVVHVVENVDWVIKWIGEALKKNLQGVDFKVAQSGFFATNSIVHYGSVNTILREEGVIRDPSNKSVVTVYHGDIGAVSDLLNIHEDVDRVVVANTIMKNRLIGWGVDREKIRLIPIGVDYRNFAIFRGGVYQLRKEFGVPLGAVCIGSFQKDGDGWGDGMVPKLIKGPDIFLDVVERIARTRKIHVLLTGPSRGFMKAGLKERGISFSHPYCKDQAEVARCYKALDLYLVTSREEGGPQALMECLASHVPLVTSRVGMAPDIIMDGVNGSIVEVGDVGEFVKKSLEILENPPDWGDLYRSSDDARALDWSCVCREYQVLYKELMEEE